MIDASAAVMMFPSSIPSCEALLSKGAAILLDYDDSLDPEVADYIRLCQRFASAHAECTVSSGILSYLPIEIVEDIFSINFDAKWSDLAQLEGPFGQIAQEKHKAVYVTTSGMFRADPQTCEEKSFRRYAEGKDPELLREIHQLHGVRIKEICVSFQEEPDWQAIKTAMRGHYESFVFDFSDFPIEEDPVNAPIVEELWRIPPSEICDEFTIHMPPLGAQNLSRFVDSVLRHQHERRIRLKLTGCVLDAEVYIGVYQCFFQGWFEVLHLTHTNCRLAAVSIEPLFGYFFDDVEGVIHEFECDVKHGEILELLASQKAVNTPDDPQLYKMTSKGVTIEIKLTPKEEDYAVLTIKRGNSD
ncbi:hypothetical protein QR680_000808 [Steinernema hermaphroditum]|uniref:Uncharacterized protein n=1 Tax=Steinernema hermaphroditum TaxID=289476 RepID=A0AA39GVZ1_9BILA|nr:hypothetical protein QR680_000808 [Steinernema hermaphroditum]